MRTHPKSFVMHLANLFNSIEVSISCFLAWQASVLTTYCAFKKLFASMSIRAAEKRFFHGELMKH